MDGQVLGGGVVAAVAVALWLVYLVPTWQSRMQYNAAERNAVRLNQALRVLAETSETPEEVRLELTAREAAAQQKLARQVQAEQARVKREESRLQADQDVFALERRRQELAAQRAAPALRQAKARRRVRLVASALVALGVIAAGLGAWALVAGAGVLWLGAGAAVAVTGLLTLQRMAAVQARTARRAVRSVPVARSVPRTAGPLLDEADRGWVPRSLPAPLTATPGSRAQAARAEQEARDALRRAAQEEALRERAAELRPAPVSIRSARPAEAPAEQSAAASPYARMGYVDDAEIEAHVRDLLARRAAG